MTVTAHHTRPACTHHFGPASVSCLGVAAALLVTSWAAQCIIGDRLHVHVLMQIITSVLAVATTVALVIVFRGQLRRLCVRIEHHHHHYPPTTRAAGSRYTGTPRDRHALGAVDDTIVVPRYDRRGRRYPDCPGHRTRCWPTTTGGPAPCTDFEIERPGDSARGVTSPAQPGRCQGLPRI